MAEPARRQPLCSVDCRCVSCAAHIPCLAVMIVRAQQSMPPAFHPTIILDIVLDHISKWRLYVLALTQMQSSEYEAWPRSRAEKCPRTVFS